MKPISALMRWKLLVEHSDGTFAVIDLGCVMPQALAHTQNYLQTLRENGFEVMSTSVPQMWRAEQADEKRMAEAVIIVMTGELINLCDTLPPPSLGLQTASLLL